MTLGSFKVPAQGAGLNAITSLIGKQDSSERTCEKDEKQTDEESSSTKISLLGGKSIMQNDSPDVSPQNSQLRKRKSISRISSPFVRSKKRKDSIQSIPFLPPATINSGSSANPAAYAPRKEGMGGFEAEMNSIQNRGCNSYSPVKTRMRKTYLRGNKGPLAEGFGSDYVHPGRIRGSNLPSFSSITGAGEDLGELQLHA